MSCEQKEEDDSLDRQIVGEKNDSKDSPERKQGKILKLKFSLTAGVRQIPSPPLRRKTQTSFLARVLKLRYLLGRGMEAFKFHPFFPM